MGIPETRSTQCMIIIFPLLYFFGFYLGAQAQTTGYPLPLEAYLDHAWSTAGLMGAVPWMADFLRMMKWDEISAQVTIYEHLLSLSGDCLLPPCSAFPLDFLFCVYGGAGAHVPIKFRCFCSPASLTTRSTLLTCVLTYLL